MSKIVKRLLLTICKGENILYSRHIDIRASNRDVSLLNLIMFEIFLFLKGELLTLGKKLFVILKDFAVKSFKMMTEKMDTTKEQKVSCNCKSLTITAEIVQLEDRSKDG